MQFLYDERDILLVCTCHYQGFPIATFHLSVATDMLYDLHLSRIFLRLKNVAKFWHFPSNLLILLTVFRPEVLQSHFLHVYWRYFLKFTSNSISWKFISINDKRWPFKVSNEWQWQCIIFGMGGSFKIIFWKN